MIEYEKFTLDNGLRVILYKDKSTPLVAMSILYDVGSKDEQPEKTGFAHLFEHFMFGGSVNIPKYDTPLEKAGGENNAFTNNDFTNYYLVFPYQNIETAMWLESDRMLSLAFSQKSLDIQKNVVIEEFKQSYLNQPYGDVWLLLRPLAYKVHPYQWDTIGKEISHIEKANIEDVKDFYDRYYNPDNAILCLAGNIDKETVMPLLNKWFNSIRKKTTKKRSLQPEPEQTEERTLIVERDVPYNCIYRVYKMDAAYRDGFIAQDLCSDLLSNGYSSRMYKKLVSDYKLFSKVSAYQMGHLDPGLFVISGTLNSGVRMDAAVDGIDEVIDELCNKEIPEKELEKVKNKFEANFIYSHSSMQNIALSCTYFELLGNLKLINTLPALYRETTKEEIQAQAKKIFKISNCSTLFYYSKKA